MYFGKCISNLFLWVCVSYVGAQDTVHQVVAQKGDGIYSMLRKFGLNPTEHYSDFIVLNQTALNEEERLIEGKTYVIPKLGANRVMDTIGQPSPEATLLKGKEYTLFGKEHAYITPISERLKNSVYYLVSGHGGPDPGAIAQYAGKTIAEDEYAYDVTLRLAKELMAHGATVHIVIQDPNDGIRDARVLELDYDEVAFPDQEIPLNHLSRLQQRVEIINKMYRQNLGKYQRLIVTHVDSRSKGRNIDVFFYHHEKSKNGKKLTESIHKIFQEKYKLHQPNRVYEGTFSDRSSLYLIKNTLPAIAYIEIGNISNPKDQKRILDPVNRQALANWISEGVLRDFEEE